MLAFLKIEFAPCVSGGAGKVMSSLHYVIYGICTHFLHFPREVSSSIFIKILTSVGGVKFCTKILSGPRGNPATLSALY